jgi:IS30 family transposase
MARNQLPVQKQNQIKEMLAARETYPAIAEAVGCHLQTVKNYAARHIKEIEKAQKEYDAQFINRGLRSREKRIEKLEMFANRIERDLEDKLDEKGKLKSGLWFKDIKLSSIGTSVNVEVFGGEAIRQYRGILDDIAKELGDRKSETKLSGEITVNQKGYLGVSPDDWEKQQEQESTGNGTSNT